MDTNPQFNDALVAMGGFFAICIIFPIAWIACLFAIGVHLLASLTYAVEAALCGLVVMHAKFYRTSTIDGGDDDDGRCEPKRQQRAHIQKAQ